MSAEARLVTQLVQRLQFSHQLIHNLELLQLPLFELREQVLKEVEENPVFELDSADEPADEGPEGKAPTAAEQAREEGLRAVEEAFAESERRTRRNDAGEGGWREQEMLESAALRGVSLRQHLLQQLLDLPLDPDLRCWCAYVVEWVDASGFIRASLEEMSASVPGDAASDASEETLRHVQEAVRIVQSLEPPGVGARTLRECLLLQVEPTAPDGPLVRWLIERHLDDVGRNRLAQVVKALFAEPGARELLGYPGEPDPADVMEDVQAAIGRVSRLNPRPGAGFGSDPVQRAFPEVSVREVEGEYLVQLEEGWLPSVSIKREYVELLSGRPLSRGHRVHVAAMSASGRFAPPQAAVLARLGRGDPLRSEDRAKLGELLRRDDLSEEEHRFLSAAARDSGLASRDREFIRSRVEAGRRLISAIEQRRRTLCRVATEILGRQRAFFDEGIPGLRPLRMQEVAGALGVHVSTVSRAVQGKWIETPRGVYPMKFFFAAPTPKKAVQDGNGCAESTRVATLQAIGEIVEAEDLRAPLSDAEIARGLEARSGAPVARRTVAKYREEIGLGSSSLRRERRERTSL